MSDKYLKSDFKHPDRNVFHLYTPTSIHKYNKMLITYTKYILAKI